MTRQKYSRRDFLVASAAAAAGPYVIPSHALGLEGSTPPSEMVRVGIAGLGGRARWILLNEDLPGAKIVAVADCELPRCDQMAAAVARERPELQSESWKKYADIRQMLDQVQCALGTDDTGPVEIWLEEKDAKAWPRVMMRYASGTLLKLVGDRHTMEDLGAIFRGENGNMEILRGHARANPAELLQDAPPDTPGGPKESIPHIANFIHCVRTREKPVADAETGHRATTICHLINICRKLGRKLQWDPQTEKFIGDDEANQLVTRPRRQGYELPPAV